MGEDSMDPSADKAATPVKAAKEKKKEKKTEKETEPKTPKKETEKKSDKTKKPEKSEKKEKKPKKPKTVKKVTVKKRPATMKRPAAGGSSSKSKLKAVKDMDAEGEEEEPMDDDPVSSQDCFEVEETTKDRSKWAKFKKLLDQGSLPDFIKKAYQEAQKLKTGKEKAIRQIVNNVLDRDPKNGSLVVNLENPALKCFKVG